MGMLSPTKKVDLSFLGLRTQQILKRIVSRMIALRTTYVRTVNLIKGLEVLSPFLEHEIIVNFSWKHHNLLPVTRYLRSLMVIGHW